MAPRQSPVGIGHGDLATDGWTQVFDRSDGPEEQRERRRRELGLTDRVTGSAALERRSADIELPSDGWAVVCVAAGDARFP